MEPLAALAVACNVLEIVSFGKDVVATCRQIHEQGSTRENETLEQQSQRIAVASASILTQTRPLDRQTLLADPLAAQLHNVADDCAAAAASLGDAVLKVKKSTGGGVRASMKAAFRTLRYKNEIKDIALRLEKLESNFQTSILVHLSRERAARTLQEQDHSTADLSPNLSEFLRRIAEGHATMPQLQESVKLEAEKTRQVVEREGRLTRDHVDNTFRLQTLEVTEDARRQKILQSLKHPAVNSRKNEIAETHADTFGWIFDESLRSGHSMTKFLQGPGDLYWVQGKAGSGKSCFMKFLLADKRTEDCLNQWIPGQNPILLSHFFWLAGSLPLEKNSKGLWSSLLYQLLLRSPKAASSTPSHEFAYKDSLEDWSPKELMDTFIRMSRYSMQPICILLDGLDEYESKESAMDIRKQISALRGSKFPVKLIVSSRPEAIFKQAFHDTPQLSLQTLTEKDIEKVARDRLQSVRSEARFGHIQEHQLDDLLSIIMRKADGVFIWVHYALHQLINDVTFCDTWGDLRERLEECPSEMHELYKKMWDRLHGQNQARFRQEAARCFQYAMHGKWVRPWSMSISYAGLELSYPAIDESSGWIFDFMIALDTGLQARLLSSPGHVALGEIVKKCEVTKSHLETRCAGLLEVCKDPTFADAAFENSTGLGGDNWRVRLSKFFLLRRSSLEMSTPDALATNDEEEATLLRYAFSMKVHFIHRTAVDFLKEDPNGQRILSEFKPSELDLAWTDIRVNLLRLLMIRGPIFGYDIVCGLGMLLPLVNLQPGSKMILDAIRLVSNSFERVATAEGYREDLASSLEDWNCLFPAPSTGQVQNAFFGIARDLLGLCTIRGLVDQSIVQEYVKQSGHGRRLAQHYTNYLLACASASFIGQLALARAVDLAQWLLAIGADPFCQMYVLLPNDESSDGFLVNLWSTTPFRELLNGALIWDRHVLPTQGSCMKSLLSLVLAKERSLSERITVILDAEAQHVRRFAFSAIQLLRSGSPFLVVEMNIAGLLQWCQKGHVLADLWKEKGSRDSNGHPPFRKLVYIAAWEEDTPRAACLRWWRPPSKDSEPLLRLWARCIADIHDMEASQMNDKESTGPDAETNDSPSTDKDEIGDQGRTTYETFVSEVVGRSEEIGRTREALEDWRGRGWLAPKGHILKPIHPFEDNASSTSEGTPFRPFLAHLNSLEPPTSLNPRHQ